jgi:hypothetical protein
LDVSIYFICIPFLPVSYFYIDCDQKPHYNKENPRKRFFSFPLPQKALLQWLHWLVKGVSKLWSCWR